MVCMMDVVVLLSRLLWNFQYTEPELQQPRLMPAPLGKIDKAADAKLVGAQRTNLSPFAAHSYHGSDYPVIKI